MDNAATPAYFSCIFVNPTRFKSFWWVALSFANPITFLIASRCLKTRNFGIFDRFWGSHCCLIVKNPLFYHSDLWQLLRQSEKEKLSFYFPDAQLQKLILWKSSYSNVATQFSKPKTKADFSERQNEAMRAYAFLLAEKLITAQSPGNIRHCRDFIKMIRK
jgi:hypothetical protein